MFIRFKINAELTNDLTIQHFFFVCVYLTNAKEVQLQSGQTFFLDTKGQRS